MVCSPGARPASTTDRGYHMNTARFIGALVFATAFIVAFNWLWHGVLLMDTYEATAKLWRPMPKDGGMNVYCYFMMASEFLTAFMLTFIYTRNYEGKGVAEGVRYGLYMGLLLAALDLGMYAWLPVEFTLVASWMLGSLLMCLGAGAVIAMVYRE